MQPNDQSPLDGNRCFLPTPPFWETKRLAREYECDIALPNGCGIGNVLMCTRAVEELSRKIGRRLRVLTAPLDPPIGLVSGEILFPIWQNNPFIYEIVNSDKISQDIAVIVNKEQDNIVQFGHMIENICFHYGVRAGRIKPSLFLSPEEMSWAIDRLAELNRPIICLHPHGTSSPLPGHPWHTEKWLKLCPRLRELGSLIEIGKFDTDSKHLETTRFRTTLREMMAIVWASDLFIGFDSSIAHIATAFDIPALVLWEPHQKLLIEEKWQVGFAPAAFSRWGYPQNRNIFILGDRDDAVINLIVSWAANTLPLVGAKSQG